MIGDPDSCLVKSSCNFLSTLVGDLASQHSYKNCETDTYKVERLFVSYKSSCSKFQYETKGVRW